MKSPNQQLCEITWSIMHPIRPTPDYMRQVVAAAAQYQVDSFEICGECHTAAGGMDGVISFRDYPQLAAQVNQPAREAAARNLQEVVAIAHQSGRQVYYWHREIMLPEFMLQTVTGLLDEQGECDLLGTPFAELLRAKIREFFSVLPGVDGLVLTLTESEFSVIHNSNPERYPPPRVVSHLIGLFAGELAQLKKKFTLRSFGSIAQDYRDLLEGVRLAETAWEFEVETKITPYDFSPFLAVNPFLKKSGRATLAAEYDSVGEFLGAGYLPAPFPEQIMAHVEYARRQGVKRHVIRVDRLGNAAFSCTQAINLQAYDQAIRQPEATAAAVWSSWAASHWSACAGDMSRLQQQGWAMVKQTHYIDGHLLFHAFPIEPAMKWLKAGGIFAVFQPGISLQGQREMWGILSEKTSPTREFILREKDEAVQLAEAGVQEINRLRDRLSEKEFQLAATAWQNATVVSRLVRAWCRCVCGYFDDLEAGREEHPRLDQAIVAAQADFERVREHERQADLWPVYAQPLWQLILELRAEYAAEFQERQWWLAQPHLIDFVVCGGIGDDYRVQRAMHASHARLLNGRLARAAGNPVFPNGSFQCQLQTGSPGPGKLIVRTEPNATRQCTVVINGERHAVEFSAAGILELPIAAPSTVTVRLEKRLNEYPWIYGIGLAPAEMTLAPLALQKIRS